MEIQDPIGRLRRLAEQYHHMRQEHKRKGPEGRQPRLHENELDALRLQYETLLERWVDDEARRQVWMEHLHHEEPAPEGPDLRVPVLFKGVGEGGATAEVRIGSGDELQVFVDGKPVKRVVAGPAFFQTPFNVLNVNNHRFTEVFDASRESVSALAEYARMASGSPPWQYARELFEDGLIDPDFALTARGRRLIAQGRAGQPSSVEASI